MKTLAFEQVAQPGGRRIRRACFSQRSSLAVSAACLVATGVRERLKALLGCSAPVRLLAPAIPSVQGWSTLLAGALVFRARGTLCDAAFVLRPADAVAFSCAAFGEGGATVSRSISPYEARVVHRGVEALAPALTALTARESPAEPIGPPYDFSTYFELLVGCIPAFRLGIALSREPAAARGPCLDCSVLLDIELELQAVLTGGGLAAGQVLALRPGAHVPMKSRIAGEARILLAGTEVARGAAGHYAGRQAISVTGTVWESTTR